MKKFPYNGRYKESLRSNETDETGAVIRHGIFMKAIDGEKDCRQPRIDERKERLFATYSICEYEVIGMVAVV